MTQHTEQAAAQSGAVPARIDLEDFIEAVTRGVTRALAAQDEVSGYALPRVEGSRSLPGEGSRSLPGPIVIGIYAPQPSPFPDLADLTGSSVTYERR